MTERTLDRVPAVDPRNRDYPIRGTISAGLPRNVRWTPGPNLDQGNEGACVGFGWAAELAATPRSNPVSDAFARRTYAAAQKVDEWQGEDYSGTSVLAGAKVLQAAGYMRAYRWGFSLNDVLLALSWSGPVVLGLNWYQGMFDTVDGFITPTGSLQGGHCLLAYGCSVRDETVLLRNSWSSLWGVKGDALIRWGDLEDLLRDQGDACVPVGRRTL